MSDSALVDYLLALADDNLVVAQRLGELVSHMPDLEEDIAVANIGLDHLGTARSLFGHAAALLADGRDEDDLAMGRDEREFRNAVLVEQPNGDYAHVTARQLFLDAFQVPFYGALAASSDSTIAGIAAKAEKEARYHLDHSSLWTVRLGDGTAESHERMQTAIDDLWHFTGDLFESVPGTDALASEGVAVDPTEVRPAFDAALERVLAEAKLSRPDDPFQRIGGRIGNHTEHLGHLLAEMQWLHRSHPGVSW